jgi:hypothetical protein
LPVEQNHILMLGCQMVTKNTNLGTYWRALLWKMLVYFMEIWSMYFTATCYILWTFGLCTLRPLVIFYGHLVYFSHFGTLYQQ